MRRLTEIAPGVLVATSDLYVTNSVIVAGNDGGCLLVDPGVTVPDLDGLVADLAEIGLRPAAGFATHPHWDHVLWCSELGDVPRYASQPAVTIAARDRSDLIEAMAEAAPGHDLDLVGRLVPLDPASAAVEWDGPEAIVITHDAHAPGHCGLFLPGTGILVAGDMCSDIEIPLLDLDQADPVSDYRVGLGRLAALPARLVIPGHGRIGNAAEFRRRMAADEAYLDALEAGAQVDDRRLGADWLRAEHARQLQRLRT